MSLFKNANAVDIKPLIIELNSYLLTLNSLADSINTNALLPLTSVLLSIKVLHSGKQRDVPMKMEYLLKEM